MGWILCVYECGHVEIGTELPASATASASDCHANPDCDGEEHREDRRLELPRSVQAHAPLLLDCELHLHGIVPAPELERAGGAGRATGCDDVAPPHLLSLRTAVLRL